MRILPSEITPHRQWLARRQILRTAAGAAGLGLGVGLSSPASGSTHPLEGVVTETPHAWDQITRHNNYYEFSSNKSVVWKLAEEFQPLPWTLTVEGEVERPRTWAIEDLMRRHAQEDRVYRLRCVEGWSMVIPWRGFALAALLKEAQPTSRARFVEFVSVLRPREMVGQRTGGLAWPYTEGLRIDEAMHPLSLMVTGLYGRPLPAQNGAPLRLAVPWKYGFKSIKAITTLRLVEHQPVSSWSRAAPSEYGFQANVNPEVPHPRWSQRREVRIGETAKRPTLPFNGYAQDVASLYTGLDLRAQF